jgi:hypothetical protein
VGLDRRQGSGLPRHDVRNGTRRGDTITGGYPAAAGVLDRLAAVGVDFDDVTDRLEREGLEKFEKSWSDLGDTVAAQLPISRVGVFITGLAVVFAVLAVRARHSRVRKDPGHEALSQGPHGS